jgi:hypothetical protein
MFSPKSRRDNRRADPPLLDAPCAIAFLAALEGLAKTQSSPLDRISGRFCQPM